jgi:hypothetical protein
VRSEGGCSTNAVGVRLLQTARTESIAEMSDKVEEKCQ